MKHYMVFIMGVVFLGAVASTLYASSRHGTPGFNPAANDMAPEHTHGAGEKGMHEAAHGAADHQKMDRETVVEGYRFAYHLTDVSKKTPAMVAEGRMPEEMAATHHLMVYIQGPDGKPVEEARVGCLVTGPDGAVQKKMAVGMGKGFGADVILSAPGTYKIKTKAVIGDETLINEIDYRLPNPEDDRR